jgi:hypothetical protein
MRRVWLVLLCVAFVGVPAATAAPITEDRGIVLRVLPPRILIRELDGSRARFAINHATVVTLNGRAVRLRRLRRGDVVAVDHAGRRVLSIQAIRP